MKKIYRNLISVALTLFSIQAIPQQVTSNPLSKGYYIVVAAFHDTQEDLAKRYASKINQGGLHSSFGLDPVRKFYYVYLDQYAEFNESIAQMLKARKQGGFGEAWVRIIKDGSVSVSAVVAKREEPVQKVNHPASEVNATATREVKVEVPKAIEEKKPEPAATEVVENPTPKPVYLPQTLNNTPVFLSLYNATNNQVIDGDIEVVDTERTRLITKVKGNTYLTLPNPGTKSGQLSLISSVFGFRKEQLEINYKNTEADTARAYVNLVGNFYMLNFGLSRIHKGDISTLYNVYFYNDAAIMLPDSKFQLNSLLQMFKENPNLKIILHGHTNGSGRGKIIYMGPSKDFFAITKDVVQGSGSSKELSVARAEVIREWLITNGVSDKGVTVKGWGGSRMIHDKNSVHARKNIRVDVEVVDE